ncbi:MAG: 50S ribosomal protein L9 [Methylophilaceae bacterium]|jgi:large subunit ribosomal protein L9|nr:50S ribosomal protein L9 [Methylophilales bacterium]
MQIILLEKVGNLGSLGDIVKVKDGYGRNFLIPQGKAKRATEANKAEIATRRVELEKQQVAILAAAQARGEKLASFVVTVSQKAGVDGRLFGSVTNGDIADALNAQGFEVTKALVRLPTGPLKTIGDHTVTVALHHDVVVDITVTVVGEA